MTRTVYETINIPDKMQEIHTKIREAMIDAKLTYSEGIGICESVKAELMHEWIKLKTESNMEEITNNK